MVSLKQYVKNDVEKKRQYFQSASPEITQQNLRLLQLASLSTVGFLLLFFSADSPDYPRVENDAAAFLVPSPLIGIILHFLFYIRS